MTWRDGQDLENLWREKQKMRRDHSTVVFCLETERRDQTLCVRGLFDAVGNLMWGCRFGGAGERGGLRQGVRERDLSDTETHNECAEEAITKIAESVSLQ